MRVVRASRSVFSCRLARRTVACCPPPAFGRSLSLLKAHYCHHCCHCKCCRHMLPAACRHCLLPAAHCLPQMSICAACRMGRVHDYVRGAGTLACVQAGAPFSTPAPCKTCTDSYMLVHMVSMCVYLQGSYGSLQQLRPTRSRAAPAANLGTDHEWQRVWRANPEQSPDSSCELRSA